MDCNDRIGMWQKGHTAQSPSACQVLPEWARHLVVCRTRQAQHKTRRASHRPSACGSSHPTLTIKCTSRQSDRKTAIRKKPGQRPSMSCDSVPQGRLSRSDQVCSTSLHQTFTLASLNNVASREAVKFNDGGNRAAARKL